VSRLINNAFERDRVVVYPLVTRLKTTTWSSSAIVYWKQERKRKPCLLMKETRSRYLQLSFVTFHHPWRWNEPVILTVNSLSRLHVHPATMDRLVREINSNSPPKCWRYQITEPCKFASVIEIRYYSQDNLAVGECGNYWMSSSPYWNSCTLMRLNEW